MREALRVRNFGGYSDAISCAHFRVGPPSSAGGNIIDWAYAEAKISVAYSVMLRDTGTVSLIPVFASFPLNGRPAPSMVSSYPRV